MVMAHQNFSPIQINQVEISLPIPEIQLDRQTADPSSSQKVLALVRLHTQPVGIVSLEVPPQGFTAHQFADGIWQALGAQINAHLRADGLAPVDHLPVSGVTNPDQPACTQARAQVLAHAPWVSVLVATHNRPDTLATTLDSLLTMHYPYFDIIVIDNAPANDAAAALIDHSYSSAPVRVRYVREDRPGLGLAHNRGFLETQAEYVAITDDDVTVDRYWLAEIMKSFCIAPDIGCVTGMIFPAEIQTIAQYWIENSVGFSKGFNRQIFGLKENRLNHPLFPYAAGMFGSGANMAFRSDVLRKMGGFDDGLGAGSTALGGDDLAAFFEVLHSGKRLVYEPAAIIYHRHHREYERLRQTVYGYGAGLTAYLTKIILDHPEQIAAMARRFPNGLHYALSAKSSKNARKAEGYPPELSRLERKGMLGGPFLYLRSRWKTKQNRVQLSKVKVSAPNIKGTER